MQQCLGLAQTLWVRMSAGAALLRRLNWGWQVHHPSGRGTWLSVGGLEPHQVGLSTELLECPHEVAAAVPRAGDLKERD